MKLTKLQEKIVNAKGNLVVMASAGTGKTHTMVSKIEKEIKENKTYKVIAAITFTKKAAKEIKSRINLDINNHFLGTNNSFAVNEIIKPFLKDVRGDEFDIEIDTDYQTKVNDLDLCIEKIRTDKIIYSSENTNENFVFKIALMIVKESKACQLYLKSKYLKIYIDEYQDTDKDMHDFFMYLCDELKIEMFVVGDYKQSIYTWRGANPEWFNSIKEKENFQCYYMVENFRSCKQIQNLSNLLFQETRDLYEYKENEGNVVYLKTDELNWTDKVLELLDINKSCAILRYANLTASECAQKMKEKGMDFVYIPNLKINEITVESRMVICCYC